MQVQLSNPGSDTIGITQNYLSGKDFDFTLTPFTGAGDTLIPPGGTQVIQVCFSPLQRGYRTATLTIRTNIPTTEAATPQDTSSFMVQFIGTGVPTGTLSITGPTTNGNLAVDSTGCVTDTLWNNGSQDVTVTGSNTTQNGTVFSPTFATFPFVISANGFTTFTVCATPADSGATTGTLNVTGNSGTKPLTASEPVNVYGLQTTDTGMLVKALPTSTCMPGNDTAYIQVINTGNVSSNYTGSLSGTNAGDFTIVGQSQSGSIAEGDTTTYKVLFTPSAPGTETVSFGIGGGSTGSSVALTGVGGAAIIAGNDTVLSEVTTVLVPFAATVQNTGTCDWTPGDVSVQSPFAYVSGGATSIPAGGTGTLNFTLDASQIGTFSSPVTFTNSTGVSIPGANVNVYAIVAASGVALKTSQDGFLLGQSYPNPNTGSSDIAVTLPHDASVSVTLVDATGAIVRTAFTGMLPEGIQTVHLDAKDLPNGTYFYTMTSGDVRLAREMIVLK
jgi:hypothetical protein